MLRVATYNVHDCIGRDGVYAPERTAAVITDLAADIVALQEVTLDHSGDLVTLLERSTGMRAIDGTLFERGVGRYGNLLLCRKPVATQALHDLSVIGREPRGLIEASVVLNEVHLSVFATHLGLGLRERQRQMNKIATLLSALSGPATLLGDFNEWLGQSAFRPLHRMGFRAKRIRSYPTWPAPIVPLDRVFVREPARIVASWRQGGAPAEIASDHFPVVADIEADHSSG